MVHLLSINVFRCTCTYIIPYQYFDEAFERGSKCVFQKSTLEVTEIKKKLFSSFIQISAYLYKFMYLLGRLFSYTLANIENLIFTEHPIYSSINTQKTETSSKKIEELFVSMWYVYFNQFLFIEYSAKYKNFFREKCGILKDLFLFP